VQVWDANSLGAAIGGYADSEHPALRRHAARPRAEHRRARCPASMRASSTRATGRRPSPRRW
jgi:hypothetical protein